MRIGLNLPDPQRISAETAPSAPKGGKIADGDSDSDSFSNDTVSLSTLATRALQSPPLRQDKVASLQHAVDSGLYQIDPKSIADAMVAR